MLEDGFAILVLFIDDSSEDIFGEVWADRREEIYALRRQPSLPSSMRIKFTPVIGSNRAALLVSFAIGYSAGKCFRDEFDPDSRLMTPGVKGDSLAKSSLSLPNQQSNNEPKTKKTGRLCRVKKTRIDGHEPQTHRRMHTFAAGYQNAFQNATSPTPR